MIIIKTTIGIVSILIALSIVYLIGRVTRRIMDPEERNPDIQHIWQAAAKGVIGGIIVWIMLWVGYLIGDAVLRGIQ
jgi:hypothetical protein